MKRIEQIKALLAGELIEGTARFGDHDPYIGLLKSGRVMVSDDDGTTLYDLPEDQSERNLRKFLGDELNLEADDESWAGTQTGPSAIDVIFENFRKLLAGEEPEHNDIRKDVIPFIKEPGLADLLKQNTLIYDGSGFFILNSKDEKDIIDACDLSPGFKGNYNNPITFAECDIGWNIECSMEETAPSTTRWPIGGTVVWWKDGDLMYAFIY